MRVLLQSLSRCRPACMPAPFFVPINIAKCSLDLSRSKYLACLNAVLRRAHIHNMHNGHGRRPRLHALVLSTSSVTQVKVLVTSTTSITITRSSKNSLHQQLARTRTRNSIDLTRLKRSIDRTRASRLACLGFSVSEKAEWVSCTKKQRLEHDS